MQTRAKRAFEQGFADYMVPISAPGGTPIDIKPKDMGKAPAVLLANGWKAVSAATAKCHSLTEAQQWDVWGASLGFGCGRAWGLVGNDGDFNDPQASHVAITAYTGVVGPDAVIRGVQDPNHHRALVPVCIPDVHVGSQVLTFRNRTTGEEGKWEVLGAGRQFVAAGPHAGTGTPYIWSPYDIFDLGPQGIPVISLDEHIQGLEAVKDALAKIGWDLVSGTTRVSAVKPLAPGNKDRVVGTVHEVKSLLALIPNDYAGWSDWVSFCHAIYAASWGAPWGREEWLDWSNQQAQTPGEPEKRWDTLNPQTIRSRGIAWLYEQAAKRDPGRTAALVFEAEEIFDEEVEASAAFGTKYSQLLRLQRQFAYVLSEQAFLDRNGTPYSRDDFNFAFATAVPSLCAELNIKPPKNKAPPKASNLVFHAPGTEIVDRVTYYPGRGRIVEFRGFQALNLWKPGARTAYPHVQDLDVSAYFKHCGLVLYDKNVPLWIKWCAYVVQFQDRKPGWHWLVISIPGLGKDMMLVPLIYALGEQNSELVTATAMEGQFNTYLRNKLVYCSESRQAGGSHKVAAHIYNDIKPYLAAPPDHVMVNPKNFARYAIPNLTAWVLFSNNEVPVALDEGDRRLFVVKNTGALASPTYYADMARWLGDKNNLDLVASFFRNYPLTAADKAEIESLSPGSQAKDELIFANLSPVEQVVDDLIQEAREGIGQLHMVAAVEDIKVLINQRLPRGNQVANVSAVLRRRGARPVVPDKRKGQHGSAGVVRTGKREGKRLWVLAEMDESGKNYTNLSLSQLKDVYKDGTYKPDTSSTDDKVVNLRKKASQSEEDV